MYAGAGIALAPATATMLIACSRAILINIVANAIMLVITGGHFGVNIHGLSLIQVPLLWQISLYSAGLGAGILVVSGTIYLTNALYRRVFC
jgi:hypothetical protein